MKRTNSILTILTAFLLTLNLLSYSQACLPEGITFTTQEQIDNFQTNYPGCSIIEGDVEITSPGGSSIDNLGGLNQLISIEGDLSIVDNVILPDLSGLENLESVGGHLAIENNLSLGSFAGLDVLGSIAGDFVIDNNDALISTNEIALNFVGGGILISGNYNLADILGFEGLTEIYGTLWLVSNSSLINISGFQNISAIYGNMLIFQCFDLINLNGLESLQSVNGYLGIDECFSLVSIEGLINLQEIGANLILSWNLEIENLEGLNNLMTVYGSLYINGNNSLNNIDALANLNELAGELEIQLKTVLSSLTGLDGIDPNTITDLTIKDNPYLTECDIMSICQYLSYPGGSIDIENNYTGCNSQEEIQEACLTDIDKIDHQINDIRIYPNPAKKEIFIESIDHLWISEIKVFNQTGIVVLERLTSSNKINVSKLKSGLYFIEIRTAKNTFRTKLIIE